MRPSAVSRPQSGRERVPRSCRSGRCYRGASDSISESQSNRNDVFQPRPLITVNKRRHHDDRNGAKPADRHDRLTRSARDIMVIDKYTHLDRPKLRELIRRLARSERDMEERLAAREKQVREAAEDNPDPVRKRLFFLLLKQRKQRRAAEKELAMRASADSSRPFLREGHP
jgi:hypothetical protein